MICGGCQWLPLFTSALLLWAASASLGAEKEQCEPTGESAHPASNLLQISTIGSGQEGEERDSFGPGLCVRLRRSGSGTCLLSTRCAARNITDTDFSFVCINPSATIPHALHSFGIGGFAQEESFDTKVECKTCMSVDTAFRTGSSVAKNALAALPLRRLPSMSSALKNGPAYSAAALKVFKPDEAAVFGPSYCISTFKAPVGTCLIRTRCAGVDLSTFNVGVTCLDKVGGYARYLFGKGAFKEDETFDTLLQCEKCLGVGPESSIFALHGLMPRKMVDDVNTLKMDVQTLVEKVRVLQEYGEGKAPGWAPPLQKGLSQENTKVKTKAEKGGGHKKDVEEEEETRHHGGHEAHLTGIPIIMMARRQTIHEARAKLPASSEILEDEAAAGADYAAMDDMGPMQLISHRRPGAAIAELLRRVNQ